MLVLCYVCHCSGCPEHYNLWIAFHCAGALCLNIQAWVLSFVDLCGIIIIQFDISSNSVRAQLQKHPVTTHSLT